MFNPFWEQNHSPLDGAYRYKFSKGSPFGFSDQVEHSVVKTYVPAVDKHLIFLNCLSCILSVSLLTLLSHSFVSHLTVQGSSLALRGCSLATKGFFLCSLLIVLPYGAPLLKQYYQTKVALFSYLHKIKLTKLINNMLVLCLGTLLDLILWTEAA